MVEPIKRKYPKPKAKLADPRQPLAPKVLEGEVIPPQKPVGEVRKVTISVDSTNAISVDLGGFSYQDVLLILKSSHGFIFNEFQKLVGMKDGNIKEGASDTTSGSNP